MPKLTIHADLTPIDEQPNDYLVQLDGSGKANGFSHQAFDPRAQREMFAFQLLCPPLADHLELRIQMPGIGPPAVGVKPANADTRAVSRMPLPFSAISTIRCLTSGTHPVL